MNPRFSIIVPVYKTEQYLRQCVDSILRQSYTDFEVILVDDGSPDGSGAICDEYAAKDSRVKVVHKENGGLVSARKAGAAVCIGEYVMNVDSDDYVDAALLQRVADVLDRYSPQVVLFSIAGTDGERITDYCSCPLASGLYNGDRMQAVRDGLIGDDCGQMAVLYSLCAAAVRRDVYMPHQNAVPDKLSRGEDMAVTTPLLHNCEAVYVLDFCGYNYRSNPSSIMNTFRANELEQVKLVVEYLTQKLPQSYEGKLDVYTATHYFDFLDRAMLLGGKEYLALARKTQSTWLKERLRRARVSGVKMKLIFFLLRYRCYGLLWLLRKMKPRR